MKMRMIMIGTLALTVLAGGCDRFPEKPTKAPEKVAPKAPQKPKTVNQPVEDAMMRIPPDLRANYQKAFICEVKREQARSKAIEVTPAYVDDLVRRLKERPSITEC